MADCHVGGFTMESIKRMENIRSIDESVIREAANHSTVDIKWNRRFVDLARLVATWSKDPSSQVGAVIVDRNRRIVSTGYNGFAVGVDDSPERLNTRDTKYKIILHAEENAIMFAKRDLTGCTIYVTNIPPCAHCASLIVQSGIKQVYAACKEIPERWKESYDLTCQVFKEAGVRLEFVE